MYPQDQIRTSALQYPKSIRRDLIRGITSGKGGRLLPIRAIPVLAGDRVQSGRIRVKIDMQETPRALMNPVGVRAYVHFVPWLAFDRFEGSPDALNKSYASDDGSFMPTQQPQSYDRSDVNLWTTLGIHLPSDQHINMAYPEAYNCIWNYLAQSRSKHLTLRSSTAIDLAPAFVDNFAHILPDYDDAVIDGEVPLEMEGLAPVRGIFAHQRSYPGSTGTQFADPGFNLANGAPGRTVYADAINGNNRDGQINFKELFYIERDADGLPDLVADMRAMVPTLNLSNIERAKQTAAFAKLRKQFKEKVGVTSDDHIIDLLMQGIQVPTQYMSQPILLERKNAIIGFQSQYASDGASLGQQVTRGATYIDLNFRTPQFNMGGVIMVNLQILPEPIFDRQLDPFITVRDGKDLPDAERDYLDPKKVDFVRNRDIDVDHDTPNGVFGYTPLNSRWNRDLPMVGGKYLRSAGDPWFEDRSAIWSPDIQNPSLTESWYLSTDLDHDVFADQSSDPFEIQTNGTVDIIGLTQFGKRLYEDGDEYDQIMQDSLDAEAEKNEEGQSND